MSAERFGRFTAAMKAGADNGENADAVVQIARRDKLVYIDAFGDPGWEQAVAMRPDAGPAVT